MHKFTIKFSLLFKAFIRCLEGISLAYICLTSVTRAKPKEKMEFPA